MKMADLIEQSVLKGEWAHIMPGHRVLMKQYGVSARTTLAAIEILQQRGVISPARKGARRSIQSNYRPAGEGTKHLLLINNKGSLSGEDLRLREAYSAAWEEGGGKVITRQFDFARYRRPSSLLANAVANYAVDAFLLHVPPIQWTKAAASLRPVFLSGGQWSGVAVTGVGYDLGIAMTEWIIKLRKIGHERIFIPLSVPGQEFAAYVRDCIAKEWGLRSDSPILNDFCPIMNERIPEAWQHCWQRAFAMIRPTAVIVTDDLIYLSLSGYCARHGLRIPGDVSIVCLESTEHLEWCDPEPTRMKFPIDSALAWFRKWVIGGCQPMGMRLFHLDEIAGQTVSTPRRKP
jgi:hypothetical protein